MKPIRVAIVSDWFAPRRGGIEAQLLELCERLGATGAEVHVHTATPGARDGVNFRVLPLDLLRLPIQDVVISPTMVRRLRAALDRGYDVVHAHVSVVSPLGYAGVIAARALGLPVVVTFHSVLRSKALLLRAADLAFGLRDTGVTWTAVSDIVASQVRGALRGADVSVLPNGVDLGFWQATHAEASSPVTLVSAGRLQRKKRPRPLVRAFAHAAARARMPARLLLLGDGPDRLAIERDIDGYGLRHGPSRVEVVGWLDKEAMRTMYASAHGFALASTAESFGIAALEARAAGLPVITMDGGSSEFLTDGRDAVLCRDDADLARALERFIDDSTWRASLAHSAPDLRRYDWAAVLAAHHATYARARRKAAVDGAGAASA